MGLLRILRRLRDDQTGTVSVQLILIVPLFALAVGLTTTAYGYFKANSRDAKAAYAMADAISRETRNINPDFMTSLEKIHEFITDTSDGSGFRVTIVDYSPYTKKYRIRWSKTHSDDKMTINAVKLSELTPSLPKLAPFESIIVLETFLNHNPFKTNVGLKPITFHHLAVSRPRNGPQTCWSNDKDPSSTSRTC